MDTQTAVGLGIAAAGGLAVGSFTCVVIDRLPLPLDEPAPTGEMWTSRPWAEVLGGRSRCSSCSAPVRPRDNIPLLGWLLLRGRCRECSERIPVFHPLVELGVALLAVLVVLMIEVNWQLLPALWLVGPAVAMAVIDLRTMIIPTRLVWPTFAVSVVLSAVAALAAGEPRWLLLALIGSAAAAAPLFVLWWALPSHMGFGDVRLCVVLGWHVGFAAAPVSDRPLVVILAVVLFLTLGSVGGIVFGSVTQVGFGRPLPFGPPLIAAAFAMIVAAPEILGPWAGGTEAARALAGLLR